MELHHTIYLADTQSFTRFLNTLDLKENVLNGYTEYLKSAGTVEQIIERIYKVLLNIFHAQLPNPTFPQLNSEEDSYKYYTVFTMLKTYETAFITIEQTTQTI